MENTIATKLFYVDPSNIQSGYNEIIENNYLVAGVRLRQMRVKEKDCGVMTNYMNGSACYYEKYEEKYRGNKYY